MAQMRSAFSSVMRRALLATSIIAGTACAGAPGPRVDWHRALAAFPIGCFARSPRSLACTTARGSTATGQTFDIAWVSLRGIDREDGAAMAANTFGSPTLAPEVDGRIVAHLRREHFVALEQPVAEAIGPDEEVLEASGLSLRWTHHRLAEIHTSDGSWDRTHEQLIATQPRACVLDAEILEGVTTRELRAWPLGDGFVVERSLTFALEGEHGGSTQVFVLARGTPCPSQ
jgi:hypothetical protein